MVTRKNLVPLGKFCKTKTSWVSVVTPYLFGKSVVLFTLRTTTARKTGDIKRRGIYVSKLIKVT